VLAVLVGLAAAGAARAEEEAGYDPNAGIDPDGRIPAIERPAGLENAERWRYVPEAKIKPGNVFQRFMTSSFIAPFVFRQADVGYGFGVAITDIDFRQQRRREFAAISGSYTTEGQMSFGFRWRRLLRTIDLPGGGVLQDERSYVGWGVRFERTLTRRFFGVGPDSRKEDESSYTDQMVRFELFGSHGLDGRLDDVVVEGGLRGEIHELSAGRRDPSTDLLFPAVFDEDEHDDIGFVTLGLRYDTRDSQRNPYAGWYAGTVVDFAPLQTDGVGARYGFHSGTVFEMPPLLHDGGDGDEENPPTDILAFGLRSELSSGALPFYRRPTLGGSRHHRGYIDGRFRDDASWLAATEYRFWVIPRGFGFSPTIRIERIGLAVFYEAGAVAGGLDRFDDARVRHSYGLGLRILLERAAPFRLDLGFSEDGINFAAGFGLSF